jgi:hypothetical protein
LVIGPPRRFPGVSRACHIAAAALLGALLLAMPASAWTRIEVHDGNTVTVGSGGTATGFRIRLADTTRPS